MPLLWWASRKFSDLSRLTPLSIPLSGQTERGVSGQYSECITAVRIILTHTITALPFSASPCVPVQPPAIMEPNRSCRLLIGLHLLDFMRTVAYLLSAHIAVYALGAWIPSFCVWAETMERCEHHVPAETHSHDLPGHDSDAPDRAECCIAEASPLYRQFLPDIQPLYPLRSHHHTEPLDPAELTPIGSPGLPKLTPAPPLCPHALLQTFLM